MSNFGRKLKAFFYKTKYFWTKLLLTLLTMLIVTVLSFVLIKSLPGDVVHQYALNLQNTMKVPYEEAYETATRLLNYDPEQNIFSTFVSYLGGLMRGNLGQSMFLEDVTANTLIRDYLPWTLLVSSTSLFLSFIIGTGMGVRMARKRNGLTDTIMTGAITVTSSIPDYLLGVILLMYLGSVAGIFPTYGAYDLSSKGNFWQFLASILHHAALPIFTCTVAQIGGWALMAKGSAVSVLGDDYVNAAVIRGLPPRLIDRRYLKRNAMLPLITSLVINFAYLFGGSAVM